MKNWIAEGVASEVNDFSTQTPEISKVGTMWKLPLISKKNQSMILKALKVEYLGGPRPKRAKVEKGQGQGQKSSRSKMSKATQNNQF